MDLTRRQILAALAAAPALGVAASAGAGLDDPRRLIVVILRGGLDGLSAVPPYADPDYRTVRGKLALPSPGTAEGIIDLDGTFGLHPALAPLAPLYAAGELLPMHALGLPHRARSHFDAQNVLESGGTVPWRLETGWLNRALALRSGTGLSGSASVPLILRGDAPITAISSELLPNSRERWLHEMALLYAGDDVLGPLMAEGLAARERTAMAAGEERPRGRSASGSTWLARTAGALLADPLGPRVAAFEIGGWDSHAGQANQLQRMLKQLAEVLIAMKDALDDAWAHTAILVTTEFGRTAAPNGTNGTDHGVGSAGLLLGGCVRGGRVLADWPGLRKSDLLDGRDLRPTLDLQAVCKGILRDHLGLGDRALDREVFPGSEGIAPIEGLVG